MNRAGARASCRVAALVCTPQIMWNVWVPECPDTLLSYCSFTPTRAKAQPFQDRWTLCCCCCVSGEEGCLRAHEGEGSASRKRPKEFRLEAGREVGVPEPPRSIWVIPGVGDPVFKLGVPEE